MIIKGLPHKLKELRILNNLTQKAVSNKLDISPSVVSGYKMGERSLLCNAPRLTSISRSQF